MRRYLKLIFLALVVLPFLTFYSCKKEEVEQCALAATQETRSNIPEANDTEYFYDDSGKLIRILNSYFYVDIIYDSQGRIVEIDRSNLILYKISWTDNRAIINSSFNDATWKQILYFNAADEVIKAEVYSTTEVGSEGESTLRERTDFFWDKGNIIKKEYYLYDYENDFELIKVSSTVYTYDDKKNPYNSLEIFLLMRPYPLAMDLSLNNIISEVSAYHNEEPHLVTNFAYEYNAMGYPVKVNYTGETGADVQVDITYSCE